MHILNLTKEIKFKITGRSIFVATLSILIILINACSTSPSQEAKSEPVKTTGETKAKSSLPEPDQVLYDNAITALNSDRLDNAEYSLNKLYKKYPNHFGISFNLAVTHFKNNDLQLAEEFTSLAKNIDKNQASLYNLLGLIEVEKKNFQVAKKHYKQAIQLDKSFSSAHYNLALLNDIYFQDIRAAYLSYLSYLELNPDDDSVKDWVDQLKYSLDRE